MTARFLTRQVSVTCSAEIWFEKRNSVNHCAWKDLQCATKSRSTWVELIRQNGNSRWGTCPLQIDCRFISHGIFVVQNHKQNFV